MPDETQPFHTFDYDRGYSCVAPQRKCGANRTIVQDGTWFRTGRFWNAAHTACINEYQGL